MEAYKGDKKPLWSPPLQSDLPHENRQSPQRKGVKKHHCSWFVSAISAAITPHLRPSNPKPFAACILKYFDKISSVHNTRTVISKCSGALGYI